MGKITVYTDGGSRNTGNIKGGKVRPTDAAAWAFAILQDGKILSKNSAGEFGKTNNYMELTAVIKSFEALYKMKKNEEKITLISDSKYVLDGIQSWLPGWKRNGWKNAKKESVKNKELWMRIDQALPYFPNIEFVWTKGHAENAGNIFVDELLNKTMDEMI
jgi:ribonuclease HI